MTFGSPLTAANIADIDPFTVIFGGTLLFFVVFVLLLGMFSKRSAIDILDWKPTRSPEVEAQNEIDDVQQMIDAQNALRRKRGAKEITEADVQRQAMEDQRIRARGRGPFAPGTDSDDD